MIAVISNPLSTQNVLVMDKIRAVISNSRNIFHYEISTMTQIDDALMTFANLNPKVLVINGGDGTVQAVLTHLISNKYFEEIPPIVVLPAGKTNMIAEDLGAVGREPHEELRHLVTMRDQGKLEAAVTSRQLLTLDGLEGNNRLCGMFFGTAGIVKGIEFCRQRIYPLNLPNILSHTLTAVLLIGNGLFGSKKSFIRTDPITVKQDARGTVVGSYFVIVVTTLNKLIMGVKPAPKTDKGGMQYLSIAQSRRVLLKSFWLFLSRRLGRKDEPGQVINTVQNLSLSLNCPVTLDGELYHPNENGILHIQVTEPVPFVQLRPVKG